MTDSELAPRRRDAEENRAALRVAASAALNLDPDASLDTIATDAGLSRRAVYGHFASRDELVGVVLEVGVARVVAALAEVRHPDPLVRLALIGARLWREVESVRVMARFAVRGPFQARIAVALEPLRRQVLDAIVEGVAAGTVRDDIDPAVLARLVEGAALSVLDEATRTGMDSATGHRLVMLSALAIVGLDAKGARELITTTPELTALG